MRPFEIEHYVQEAKPDVLSDGLSDLDDLGIAEMQLHSVEEPTVQ